MNTGYQSTLTSASGAKLSLSEAEHQIALSLNPIHGQLRPPSFEPAMLVSPLLTGGGDKPYALGMAAALTSAGICVDFIGSDDLNVPEVVNNPRVNFLNLRGDQRPEASLDSKVAQGIKVLPDDLFVMQPRQNQSSSIFCGTTNSSFSIERC